MKKPHLVLLGLFPIVIGAVIIQKVIQSKRPGRIVLFAPPSASARVTVDGNVYSLAAGQFTRLEATHGQHEIHIAGGPTRVVMVDDGFDLIAVPTLAEQCFAEIDVTLSHYGAGKSRPNVTRVFRYDHPFQLPKSFALAEAELPKQVTERVNRNGKIVDMRLVFMFRSVPCAPGQSYYSGSL